MTFPGFLAEVAFDGVTWTDVTAFVRSVQVKRGRSREVDQITAGTATLVLQNDDGRFTPGRAASPFYPNVKPSRPLRLSLNPGAQHFIYTGKSTDFLTGNPDSDIRDPLCNVPAVDAFEDLARRTSRSLYAETVLDNPQFPCIGYYPLSEAATSTTFANAQASVRLPPAQALASKYGAGVFSAGNQQGFMAGAPAATCCTFSHTGSGNAEGMTVIQLAGGSVSNGAVPPSVGPWTWGVWVQIAAPPGDTAVLLYARGGRKSDPAFANAPFAYSKLWIDAAGKVNFQVSDPLGVTATATSAASVTNGVWTYITASLGADQRTVSLFVNSTTATATAASSMHISVYSWFVAGALYSPWGEAAGALNGSLASVELYSAVDTSLGNGIRWLFGRDGFYLSDGTMDQVTNIAQNFGFGLFAAPFVVVDPSGTTKTAAFDQSGNTFLQNLQTYMDTEQGVLYIDGGGSLIGKGRASRVNQAAGLVLDNAQDAVNVDTTFGVDRTLLCNEFAAQRPGGGSVVRVRDLNTSSLTDYGVYSNATTDADAPTVLVTTDGELVDFCGYKVAQYGQARPRSPKIVVDLLTNPSMWAACLAVDIGSRVSTLNLPDWAPAPNMDWIIESMQWDLSYSPPAAQLTLETSPADLNTYLTADDPIYGLADNNAAFY